jgi:hypothetical protein
MSSATATSPDRRTTTSSKRASGYGLIIRLYCLRRTALARKANLASARPAGHPQGKNFEQSEQGEARGQGRAAEMAGDEACEAPRAPDDDASLIKPTENALARSATPGGRSSHLDRKAVDR